MEKKVASRQERLLFEQLIRKDMQMGIQRMLPEKLPTPNYYITETPQQNNNMQPRAEIPSSEGYRQGYNPSNQNKIPTPNSRGIPPKRLLAKKFNINVNRGKRDQIWAYKRQLKYEQFQEIVNQEQSKNKGINGAYQQQNGGYNVRRTPSNYGDQQQQYSNYNNPNRRTPSNYGDTYNQQQQYSNYNNPNRRTPSNYGDNYNPQQQQQVSYNQNRRTPSNYGDNYQQQQMRNTPYNQQQSNNYISRTPQTNFEMRKTTPLNYEVNNNLRGTRTPFVDYKPNQSLNNNYANSYNYTEPLNRPSSRPNSKPFDDISFKHQQRPNQYYGDVPRGYQRISNRDNYY